jgi:uncharacterized membrane protein YedE/YeeE
VSAPRPYADPYVAGAGLGLVLLASFVLTGRGLGASGAFATAAANLLDAIVPGRAAKTAYFARYLDGDWWLVLEVAGVAIGGFVSALVARRFRAEVERGPRMSRNARLALAAGGGALMGAGAVLARGCTSGLALTGGALLAAGSWLFMIAAFAAAYLFAPLLKKAWR